METTNALRAAFAEVTIVGLLKKKEMNIRNTARGEGLSGTLTVETTPGNEVRIKTYTNHMTKGSADKPSKESAYWKNHKHVMDEYVSMGELMAKGASEEEARAQATRLSAKCQLRLNDYYGQDGSLVSTPEVNGNGSFFNQVSPTAPYQPCASFDVEGYIVSKRPEMKGDNETGRLILEMIVPGYGGAAQPMTFMVSEEASGYIDDHYTVGSTVRVYGEMINRANEVTTRKAGFMRDEVETTTTYVNEILIRNGIPEPYDEDSANAYKRADVEAAMRVRELEYLPSLKQRNAESRANKSAAPAAGFAGNNGFAGFAGNAPQSATGFRF